MYLVDVGDTFLGKQDAMLKKMFKEAVPNTKIDLIKIGRITSVYHNGIKR